ncbi:MAG: mannose-1-phosphate guanylyltransferase/mannose-6-phosphate isomerase [Alphaproteobacteria bacterium]|nr:mannose-1-phosphate guanylyltransferase/mannose-6-phosphate isomerase [Alphaproteobacteria bacterium]
MSNGDVFPVLMCGGSGTRLWPLSRKNHPKQFIPLLNNESLFDLTLKRSLHIPGVNHVVCVANEAYRFPVSDAIEKAGASSTIILEPVARNTAAALGCAAINISNVSPDATLVCLPADHVCNDLGAFADAVSLAIEGAGSDLLMTLGVKPERPTSAYGYMVPGDDLPLPAGAAWVKSFVEKPDPELAETLIKEGARWNAGIFVVKASVLVDALKTFAPDIHASCADAVGDAKSDGHVLNLDAEAFSACRADSIDYAVLEKYSHVGMVPLEAYWSDVGSWSTLSDLSNADAAGNQIEGDAKVHDCSNVFVRSPHKLTVTAGVNDLMIVDTPDALLVTSQSGADGMKQIVAALKDENREEVIDHRKINRPWGAFERIDLGPGFQVKRITVKPGCVLSLQYHHHRSEHWVVVTGTALVTCDDQVFTLKENQSTYIPLGAVHRLENPGTDPLELIEVQCGTYLGEDDIVRLDDKYGRMERVEP